MLWSNFSKNLLLGSFPHTNQVSILLCRMCYLGFCSVQLTQQHCLSLLLPFQIPCHSADPSYSCPQEITYVLGERKISFKFGGNREDLPGIGDFITSNKLHAASSCMWCQWRGQCKTLRVAAWIQIWGLEKRVFQGKEPYPKEELVNYVLYFWKHWKAL